MPEITSVQRLCESWWEQIADSTRDDQHRFAERFLRLLNWNEPDDLEPAAVPGQPTTLSYVTHPASETPLAAYFVLPGMLEPPGAVTRRGLDFCQTTHALTRAALVLGVRYAFVTDLFRFYLYDVRTEELLLAADTPTAFAEQFGDVLAKSKVRVGSLDEVRRQPRSYVARHLRDWLHRWTEKLTIDWRAPEEAASLALDRLVVLRFLLEHAVPSREGEALIGEFSRLLGQAATGSLEDGGKRLSALFAHVHRNWNAQLFAPQPVVEAIVEQDGVATPLLRELAFLSRAKFTIPTILESFNYGEAAEKARVRMIPDNSEERRTYLAQRTIANVDSTRIEIDLADEGYRAVLHWFDALVELYERLGIEFEAAASPDPGLRADLDLIGWSEINAQRPRALTDKLSHAVEEGLTIYCGSPRQYRTVRLMLYLHVIAHSETGQTKFAGFPHIEKALLRRPRMLESDRRRVFAAMPEPEAEWEVI